MTDPKKPSIPALLRRIEKLEALLDAEKAAHAETFGHYRDQLWESVAMKTDMDAIRAILNGVDV